MAVELWANADLLCAQAFGPGGLTCPGGVTCQRRDWDSSGLAFAPGAMRHAAFGYFLYFDATLVQPSAPYKSAES